MSEIQLSSSNELNSTITPEQRTVAPEQRVITPEQCVIINSQNLVNLINALYLENYMCSSSILKSAVEDAFQNKSDEYFVFSLCYQNSISVHVRIMFTTHGKLIRIQGYFVDNNKFVCNVLTVHLFDIIVSNDFINECKLIYTLSTPEPHDLNMNIIIKDTIFAFTDYCGCIFKTIFDKLSCYKKYQTKIEKIENEKNDIIKTSRSEADYRKRKIDELEKIINESRPLIALGPKLAKLSRVSADIDIKSNENDDECAIT